MRGESPCALPVIGWPAVQAFRACDGCGWQNGNWLLMACINLFAPGGTPEKSAVIERVSDPARLRPFSLIRGLRIGQACPAPFT
jgi:hypothetical protein